MNSPYTNSDREFMTRALELARAAADNGEVPVGAVVVIDGGIVGAGSNSPITDCDPSAHAEVLAIRAACKQLGNYRLPGATLYVTIEPCTMCLGVLMHARVSRLVFGAPEPKAGVLHSHPGVFGQPFWNHSLKVEGGLLAAECGELIQSFFKSRRARAKPGP